MQQSFKDYFEEGFSLNPLEWFVKKLTPEEREEVRKKCLVTIKKLKDIAKVDGYKMIKDEFAYTSRTERTIALSKTESREEFKDPLLTIPYVKVMFTLAHEVGHTKQWMDEDNKHQARDFFHQELDTMRSKKDVKHLHHIQKLWYELDAWVKGMDYIPSEFVDIYKKYALDSYQTYMDKKAKTYLKEALVKELLKKLSK
jgi:hypothetical protein